MFCLSCVFTSLPAHFRFFLCVHVALCVAVCAARSLSQGSANAAVLDVTQTGGHKKRVRRSSFLNAKKLYEDAQMARKVKQYLSKLSLETNEESLQTLSLQCEPSISTCEFERALALCCSLCIAQIFLGSVADSLSVGNANIIAANAVIYRIVHVIRQSVKPAKCTKF